VSKRALSLGKFYSALNALVIDYR